jgi:protein gp37
MALNKQKGNMYSDITHTWNPLGGKCLHDCAYCSTHKLSSKPVIAAKYSGEIRLANSVYDNLGKGKTIFVCAQNDLFAAGVDQFMIERILNQCRRFPDNIYHFQTKNPDRFNEFTDLFPKNSILCTTIETNRWYQDIMHSCPLPIHRSQAMFHVKGFEKRVTIEPIIEFDEVMMYQMINLCKPDVVYVGADSGNNKLPEPGKKRILDLIEEIKSYAKVQIKSNLTRLLK